MNCDKKDVLITSMQSTQCATLYQSVPDWLSIERVSDESVRVTLNKAFGDFKPILLKCKRELVFYSRNAGGYQTIWEQVPQEWVQAVKAKLSISGNSYFNSGAHFAFQSSTAQSTTTASGTFIKTIGIGDTFFLGAAVRIGWRVLFAPREQKTAKNFASDVALAGAATLGMAAFSAAAAPFVAPLGTAAFACNLAGGLLATHLTQTALEKSKSPQ